MGVYFRVFKKLYYFKNFVGINFREGRTNSVRAWLETSSMADGFSVSSMVRGYHVYKDVWEATNGEVLQCTRDQGNRYDPFAVAVTKNGDIVGHVPRTISAVC